MSSLATEFPQNLRNELPALNSSAVFLFLGWTRL
jgi:hypothetical protein